MASNDEASGVGVEESPAESQLACEACGSTEECSNLFIDDCWVGYYCRECYWMKKEGWA